MNLIPAFELGLWNAWILVLFMFLFIIGLSPLVIKLLFGSSKSQESSKRHSAKPELSEREKKIESLSTVTLVVILFYSVFLPMNLGTVCFILGSLFIF